MNIQYNIASNGDSEVLSAVLDGRLHTADNDHPNYTTIRSKVLAGTATEDDFNTALALGTRLRSISDRLSIAGNSLVFDGDVLDNSLSRHILHTMNLGLSFRPFVNFLENLYQNPQEHSREQLFTWLRDRDFTITEDGCFIAYKGVREDYTSIHSGPGIVNGVAANGHLDNGVGNTVEIARSSVQHDPGMGCASGLHAGTFDYAYSFAQGALLKVKINPRDVVSVPTDCDGQKMRVSRYKVLEVIDAPETRPVVTSEGDEYDDYWEDNDVADSWEVRSKSDPSVYYTITEFVDGERECTCPGFTYRDTCKHTD